MYCLALPCLAFTGSNSLLALLSLNQIQFSSQPKPNGMRLENLKKLKRKGSQYNVQSALAGN
jgi:hypothetical protein